MWFALRTFPGLASIEEAAVLKARILIAFFRRTVLYKLNIHPHKVAIVAKYVRTSSLRTIKRNETHENIKYRKGELATVFQKTCNTLSRLGHISDFWYRSLRLSSTRFVAHYFSDPLPKSTTDITSSRDDLPSHYCRMHMHSRS